MNMNTDYIKHRLTLIDANSGDNEHAHRMEDDLYTDFVKYVSKDCDNPELAAKAKLILTSKKIQFDRWYA